MYAHIRLKYSPELAFYEQIFHPKFYAVLKNAGCIFSNFIEIE